LDQWNAQLAATEASIASLTAQLGDAQWRLDETIVRAPSDGYVYNLQLRPGYYVTSIPLASAVSFVSSDDHKILSSFSQSAIRYINIGDAAELVFRSKPGRVYAGTVVRIARASGTSQLTASSQLPTFTGQPENSRWAVIINFDNEAEEEELPQSAGASIIAIYTQKGKPVHIISKVVMRMNAWMGYLTSP